MAGVGWAGREARERAGRACGSGWVAGVWAAVGHPLARTARDRAQPCRARGGLSYGGDSSIEHPPLSHTSGPLVTEVD